MDWDFQISDLVQNPAPVLNLSEFRGAQLAKSTLLTSTLGFLGSFQICSGAKERVGLQNATGSYRSHLSLVKVLPRFLSLLWKTCL